MSVGLFHVIAGVAGSTLIVTDLVAVVKCTGSSGVKVTDSVCPVPTPRMIPLAGVYANVPGVLAVALSCAGPSSVP